MKHKRTNRLLASILSICLLVTMMPATAFATGNTVVVAEPVVEEDIANEVASTKEEYFEHKDAADVTEEDVLLEESGEGYTTFSLGGDRRLTVFFTEDVRYENEEGDLVEYDPSLIEVETALDTTEFADSYVYENAAGDNKLFIPETLSEDTPILMQKGDYAITMVPTDKTYKDFFGKTVKIKTGKAKVKDALDKEKEKTVKASYKDETALAYIEYTSKNSGIKEDIILTKRPAKNILEFEVTAKGTYPVLSDADGSIGFYDKNTDELVSMIEPPNMNDATGGAYSEDLYYTIVEKDGESDTYILTLTIDKDYLKDKERVYPVTIDPATSWVGDSSLRDVYVSSANSSTNYYSTARTSMPVGKGSSSTYRTFIHFYNLKSAIEGHIVDTAYLNVYENADSYSGRTIRAYRVTESWTASSLTWDNQPTTASSSTASITTTGIDGYESYFNLLTFTRNIADDVRSNYGIMLRNSTESSTGYTEFYGARSSSTSYRPNLYVEYTYSTAKPNVYLTDSSLNETGQMLELRYNNLAASLTAVDYIIRDDSGNTVVDYTDIGTDLSPGASGVDISTTATLADGTYTIAVRGTYYNGKTAESNPVTFTVDRQPPGAPTLTLDDDVILDDNGTYITWSNITGNIASIQYKIVPCTAYGTPISPDSVSYSTLASTSVTTGSYSILSNTTLEDGIYAIYVRAVGTNGQYGDAAYILITINRNAPEATVTVTELGHYAIVTWYVSTSEHPDFDYVELWLDGYYYDTSYNSSGSKIIWFDGLEEGRSHTIDVVTFDVNGQEKDHPDFFYVPYQDYFDPEIGTITLTHSDGTVINENNWYTKETGTFTVSYSGITDTGSGIDTSTLKCIVFKDGDKKNPLATLTTTPTSGSDGYSGSFTMPMDDDFAESGRYAFEISVQDDQNNSAAKTITYNKDTTNPEGSISVLKHTVDVEATELRDIVRIFTGVNDSHSGVKSATLVLKNNDDETETVLLNNVTEDIVFNFDTTAYSNGNYSLILTVTDNVNHTITKTLEIPLDNRILAPVLRTSATASNVATVTWNYSQTMDKLASLEYSVDNGTNWIPVSIGDSKQSGSFQVHLPASTTGTYDVIVRGVDTDGVKGKEKTVQCAIDATGPTVSILSLENGILNGTISDANLSGWQVSVKEKDAEDTTYTTVAEGTDAVDVGRIAIVDLSGTTYVAGTTYTVKVEATDILGNVSSATCDVLKDEAYQSASLLTPTFFIERGENQSYASNHFLVGTQQTSMNLTAAPTGTVQWFVENALVSSESTYTDTFASKYAEGVDYKIALQAIDAEGNRTYSADLIQNAASYVVDWGSVATSGLDKEVTVTFAEPVTSFILNTATESSEGNAVTYLVKVGTGEYQTVTPGTRVYVNALNASILTADSIAVKATVTVDSEWTNLAAGNVAVDVLDAEYFQMSTVENYVPKNLSVEEGLNYKTYIKWQTESTTTSLPDDVYYEVYRGITPGFVPSVETLAADDVKAEYWSEMNVNFSETYYYKVRAVKKDSAGNIVSASTFSNEMSGTVVSFEEYTKRLGQKGYWAYSQLDVPEAAVVVELSKGNLVYSQLDAAITNQQLAVELSRAYNSQATSKGAFGYGWTHSYDMELLSLCESDVLAEGSIVLKDGNGTLFWFEKKDDGSYASSMGSYITLEKEDKSETITLPDRTGGTVTVPVNSAYTMTTKEKVECRFNSGGQLIYLADNNGNLVLVEYDNTYGIISKITTGQNVSIVFGYDAEATGDPLLVETVTMPDGQVLQYSYSSGKLTKVTEIGDASTAEDDISYEYSYGSNNQMDELKDAMGNAYGITYDGYNRVTGVTYPSTTDKVNTSHAESLAFTYATSGDDNSQTVVAKYLDADSLIASETYQFEALSGSRTKYIDAEGYVTEYTFQNNLPIETKYTVIYGEVLDGTVEWKEATKTEKTAYNENLDVKTVTDAAGNTIECTFLETAGKTHLISELWERTPSNVLVRHESYEYDSKENISKMTDHLNNTVTEYTYNYTGAGKGQVATEKVYITKNSSRYLQKSTSVTYSYDSQNRFIETRVETVGDVTATFVTTYDAAGKLVSENVSYTQNGSSQGGKTASYTYNGVGQLISATTVETAPNTSSVQNTTTYTYDKNGNVKTETHSNGTTNTYVYDAADNLVSETLEKDNNSKTWTTSYGYENITIHTGIGVTETYTNAYVITETLASGGAALELSKTYQDKLGRVIREVSQGVQTDYTYDAQSNVQSTYQVGLDTSGAEDSSTAVHTLTLYDENGNKTVTLQMPVYSTDTQKYTVGTDTIVNTNAYDEKGNLVSVTDGLGNTTKYTYDSNGQVTSVILADGTKTSFEYNVYDTSDNTRKTITTYANGAVSETKYNATGSVVKISDKGTTEENPAAMEKTYEYDSRGNILKETYTAGNYKTYEYDARDRSVAVNYYDSADSTVQSMRTEYTYSISDLVTAMKDYQNVDGTLSLYRYTAYTYDSFGRLSGKAEINTSTAPTEDEITAAMISYEYDINDNLVKVTYPDAASSAVQALNYTYDSVTQNLTAITKTTGTGSSDFRTYSYYADGKLHTTSANGITETYTYDDFRRIKKKVYTVSNTEKESHEYEYDANSNITKEIVVNSWPSSSGSQVNEVRTYTYDNLGQLTQSVVTGSKSETTLYEYDIVGNRKKETIGTTVTEYHYNSQNKLLEEVVTASGTEDAVISYTYDANGNLTLKENSKTGGKEAYGYDAANQMSSYALNGTVMQTNIYNGEGQRIQKTAGSNVTNYFYGNSGLLYTTDGSGELKALQHYDAYGDLFANSTVNGTVLNQYYYTDDIRGSIVNLVDASNTAVVSYTYTDFGEATEAQSGSIENEIRFTGGVYDEETGLYYLNARFYDPSTGRFLNPDSYRGEAADPQTLHLYAYCANNPITRIDPTGHAAETVVDVVFLGISINAFRNEPNAANFVFMVWDGVATVTPFVPGSYVAKSAKILTKADIVDELGAYGIKGFVKNSISNAIDNSTKRVVKKSGNNAAKKATTTIVKVAEKASSRVLRNNMKKAGIKVPNYANAAHHIVAGTKARAQEARNILSKYGVGINDAANGIFLPTSRSVKERTYHPSLHSNEYIDKVNDALRGATSKEDVLAILDDIREQLMEGTFL